MKSDRIIEINEEKIKNHLGEFVRGTVEETLNAMLDAEADAICNAQKYEHTPERKDTRAGSYGRKLQTKAGELNLKVPKLRTLPFDTAIIDRYRRREISVEESLVEMYLAGVSVRRVEDITEALWGTKVSPGTISNLNKKVYAHIEAWRNRKITGDYSYVYLDGIWLKRSWGGEVRNISILIALGVTADGFREILGVAEGAKEDKESWQGFLRYLKSRGLKGIRLFISDKSLGLVESIAHFYPEAKWQRCIVHFYRNVFTVVPHGKVKYVATMLKAIHAQEDKQAAMEKAHSVAKKLKEMKLPKAAELVLNSIEETLTYYDFPDEHRRRIRTNNPLERIMREIRRRTRVVGAFPDGESALMLVAARLRYIASRSWGAKRYLNMDYMKDLMIETA
ncbi:MAG: IS256 family transposase [Spirochaetota bacterium]|jgi:putative transposase